MMAIIKFVFEDENGDEVHIPYGYLTRADQEIAKNPSFLSVFKFITENHSEFLKMKTLVGVEVNGKWFTSQEIVEAGRIQKLKNELNEKSCAAKID